MNDEPMYLIEKQGLYYRPEARGYTGLKSQAGRYSFEEAVKRVGPNGPEGAQDGMSMWRESEAPDYSLLCAWDVKMKDRARKEALDEAADAIRALLPEGGSAPPQDQTDRLIDTVRRQDVSMILDLKNKWPTT